MGLSKVHYIISRTCTIIWNVLTPLHLKSPTIQVWNKIVITAPWNSASLYCNYKGTFSLVLKALVDADYKFIYVDTGDYGSNADGSFFLNSLFGQAFINGQLDIPPPKPLPIL